jgi:acetolactate synthase-1/2/3 large subunit
MTFAGYIADQLFKSGVRHVFGIPGGASVPYLKEFRSAGIEFILTSGEAAAAIMADVTARLTGIPGVCHSTLGPGAVNLASGLGGAFLDRSPVIAITNEPEERMINRTTQMNINQHILFSPVTKASLRAGPDSAEEILSSAFSLCREEYPGPVHISLPADLAETAANGLHDISREKSTSASSGDTGKIISLLRDSRRPLIAAGLTAFRHGAGEYLMNFLEKFKVPVVVTPMAKGLIPEEHPSFAGVLFHSLSDYLKEIYSRTDLVIGLGYDQVEYNYESWIPDVPLVHFDTRETDLPEKGIVEHFTGTPEEWFSIMQNLNPGALISEIRVIGGIRNEMAAVFNGFKNHFGPVTAQGILMEELPSDSIVTVDVGSHLHLAGQYWKIPGKGKLLMTNGWSGMGFGIPAAIAAQIHNPDKRVVCITGDGGFLMMAGELMVARRLKLPVIIVVFSDGELNLIRLRQTRLGHEPDGTLLYSGDLFDADIFLGIKVIHAGSIDEMTRAVREALNLDEPVIINATIDPEDYTWLIE